MERLAALAAEMRHMMGVFRYVRWAAGLSDAALAGPVAAGESDPDEAALRAEAMRAEAESRTAPPGRRTRSANRRRR